MIDVKHVSVAELVLSGADAVDAYMQIFGVLRQTAVRRVRAMMNRDDVREYIYRRQNRLRRRIDYTVETAIAELEEIQKQAMKHKHGKNNDQQLKVAVDCIDKKAKLLGLYAPEKHEVSGDLEVIIDLNA